MSAIISDCGKYRYRLIRDLGMMGNGAICFVMLNPSTADATQDDPTIRRCIGYGRTLGAARLEVVNLFAYRSTDPAILTGMSRDAAIGQLNDHHICEAALAARIVVCAWGNHGALFKRDGRNYIPVEQRAEAVSPPAISNDVLQKADKWKGRADDAGLLARELLRLSGPNSP